MLSRPSPDTTCHAGPHGRFSWIVDRNHLLPKMISHACPTRDSSCRHFAVLKFLEDGMQSNLELTVGRTFKARSAVVAALAASTLHAACGGGGDGEPATGPSAEGVYGGTLTGSTSSAFEMLVLENYDTPAMLSAISGSWSITELSGEDLALTVASSGAFTAASSLGCNFSGTVRPRASGKNVYNVALTFGPAPCELTGQAPLALRWPTPSPAARRSC